MAYPSGPNLVSTKTKTFVRYGSETVTCKFNLASYYDPQENKTKVTLYTTVSNYLTGQYNWYGGVNLDGTLRLSYNGTYPANISKSTWSTEFSNNSDGTPSKASYTITWKKGGDYRSEMGSLFGFYDHRSYVDSPYGFNTSSQSGTLSVYSPTFYTLTIDLNDGSTPATESHAPGYIKDLVTPSRTGYSFTGWTLSGSGTLSDNTYTYAEGNDTLTANWQEVIPETYIINYNANGGTGAPESQTKEPDVDITLSDVVPVRNLYVFGGWGLTPTSTVAAYQPEDTYSANTSITLYAIWEEPTEPSISSITLPDASYYLIKDDYARKRINDLPRDIYLIRDLIAQKDANIQYFTSQALSAASNAEILRIVDSSITPKTICINIVIDNPSYVISDISWTSYDGYIAFTGTCTAVTTADVTLAKKQN